MTNPLPIEEAIIILDSTVEPVHYGWSPMINGCNGKGNYFKDVYGVLPLGVNWTVATIIHMFDCSCIL